MVNDIMLEAIDKKMITALILALIPFDSVSHEILLHKLRCVGASPEVVQWFKSYLSGRSSMYVLDQQCHQLSRLLMACHNAKYYHHYCSAST